MEIPMLTDVVIILGLAVVVIMLFQRFRFPTILGFLATGVITGPHGFRIVPDTHQIEVLAEIGVILLLFIIGMEFSLKSLSLIKRTVFLGGAVQVFLTIILVALLLNLAGMALPQAVFIGFLFSLSSTAIVLKLLQDKGEINSPHGKTVLAILIFQDIIVVPMMLVTPLMAGGSQNIAQALLFMLVKGAFVIVFVLLSARYLVPWLLYQVAQTKSRELFILSVVVICFAVAWLTSRLGLSLALGAFMAGLIISESEYSHQATSNIIPFREIFSSFFFVSIGMLLDATFMMQHLPYILGLTLLIMLVKAAVATIAAKILQYPLRTSLMVGLAIFQVGEFAFILSKTGINNGLLSPEVYQYFLSVSLLTMAFTPFVINKYQPLASGISQLLGARPHLNQHTPDHDGDNDPLHHLSDHVVIIGFGINGRYVAKAAKYAGIPYAIVELDATTVRRERQLGEPIVYGDAVHSMILHHVNIHKARVVVVAVSDPVATKRIIISVRQLTDKVHVIVRTLFVLEMEENYRLGADEVVPEEFETSIEIFTRVLAKYLMPRDQIEAFTNSIRASNYQMLRTRANRNHPFGNFEIDLPDFEVASYKIFSRDDGIINLPLREANIRRRFNITIVGIYRDGQIIHNIDADTTLERGDVVYVAGSPPDISCFGNLIRE
ncbi:monovalent cation:proton antiporter-2 (CPA2) family protein [Adhaeribacter rhizoryzae]|uniref:Potassium transporter KefB n=1 Tax=Adhaeribacter rhizoryzae TaxID=2607907 RepID=A0A5M6DEM7_9BACT|nr:monovalent cation:proton antiporter-2 (CPA2) family protein [Adhaeribacter rhizoryzae]KAA5544866.1 potassium transporter KefB [Adhaeribacter rhizoryzae]